MSEVALCIRGEDRFVGNSENLKSNVVDSLGADVFAVLQRGENSSIAKTLDPVAVDYRDFSLSNVVDELRAEGLNEAFWKESKADKNGNALHPFSGVPSSALLQYKAMKQCQDMIESYEANSRGGISYKWVVVMRSDHWCMVNPFSLTSEDIYVPGGQPDWGGLNDRMIAMPRSVSGIILVGSWKKLVSNTHQEDFKSNTEFAHKVNVEVA